MKQNLQKTSALLLSSLLLLAPLLSSADVSGGGVGPATFPNPIGAQSLTELLTKILDAVTIIVFPFIVLFIVYAGFKMVAAQGNPGELQKAKMQIVWAVVGALIILSAQAISIAIKGTVEQIRGVPF